VTPNGRRDRRARARTLGGAMKTYEVRTFGCQMNVHDSERLAGLLETAGYVDVTTLADPPEVPDVVVFNTCAVRENADNKLYGNLGQLRPAKVKTPICRSPSGAAWPRRTARPSSSVRPGSMSSSAPTTSARCPPCSTGPGTTPGQRWRSSSRSRPSPQPCRPGANRAYAGWVSISVGCNNTCTFCIVPSLRGKEQDRRPGDILAEIEALVVPGRHRGDPARSERQHLRRRVR
jgi:tRNA-2-methylthio-N6-dimethylallyladenosine synthase